MASSSQMEKIKIIKEAIKSKDIAELKKLAIKHGFINNKLRKQAWSLALGNKNNKNPPKNKNSYSNLLSKEHKQIDKDIQRSCIQYYNLKNIQKSQLILGRILHDIFYENSDMHYIQGFNDVTSVIYTVCNNEKLSKTIATNLARKYFRNYIMVNYNDNLNINSLETITRIIKSHDITLSELLNCVDFGAISVSWLITWFAHSIQNINIITRIYDYLIYSAPDIDMISYLCSSICISLKVQLLSLNSKNIPIFYFFNQLKWDDIDINCVIQFSEYLSNKYPPNLIKLSTLRLSTSLNTFNDNTISNTPILFDDSPDSTDSISWDDIILPIANDDDDDDDVDVSGYTNTFNNFKNKLNNKKKIYSKKLTKFVNDWVST